MRVSVLRALRCTLAAGLALTATGLGCTGNTAEPRASSPSVVDDRVLVLIARGEPDTLSSRPLRRAGGGSFAATLSLFNAGLAVYDGRQDPHASLAQTLPSPNSDDWRVFPDGRMESKDPMVRMRFPSLSGTGHTRAWEPPLTLMRAAEIPRPENRYLGSNRGGWDHPDAEQRIADYERALDRRQRDHALVEMMRIVADEVPMIPLYYNLKIFAHARTLEGPQSSVSTDGAVWNIHNWRWQ